MFIEPLFFEPIFKERIWGGTNLTQFGYHLPSDFTGECWAFAAHPNGQSVVKNGEFKGNSLGLLWDNHRELFGNVQGQTFPLLTKILDANDDLSVQVHPNDEYAHLHEKGELGKTECWYIIDCHDGAEIVFGHHAKSKKEFEDLVAEGKWDQLLRTVKVKKGEFYFVPSGTIHAIGKGIQILETQQNSDTTYRVYDYDRTDQAGEKRELHIEKSIDVSTVPHVDPTLTITTTQVADCEVTTFIQTEYFSVYKWNVHGSTEMVQNHPFQLASVIDGDGTLSINEVKYPIQKGDHFLLPAGDYSFTISGDVELIVSHL